MHAEMKRKVLSASNAFVVLTLIASLLALVFGVIYAFKIGNFLYATAGIVTMYLVFMGSDVLCRRYLRPQ
ncbi:MAG: hypothetical protein R2834_00500 [Rhodothermales bacterium]